MTLRQTIRELLMPRRLVTMALLVAAWCALWGAVAVANVLAGALAAVTVMLVAGLQPGHDRVRLVPAVQFVWLVAIDLVVSTVNVAWEILTPTDHSDEAIIAVDTSIETRSHLLGLVVAITVTPGTAVVDSDIDTGRLYLHLLHADKADDITAHVQRLADLAGRALPVSAGREEVLT